MRAIAFLIFGLTLFAQQSMADLIRTNEQFYPGGSVTVEETERFSKRIVIKTEEGTINGVDYRFYYSNGGGSFAAEPGNNVGPSQSALKNWATRCQKDPISEAATCQAYYRDLSLVVTKSGESGILVGSGHYPGSDVTIRVNGGSPEKAASAAQFSGDRAESLLRSMNNGSRVVLRYQEWPSGSYTDVEFQLHGFEEVRRYLGWAVKKID